MENNDTLNKTYKILLNTYKASIIISAIIIIFTTKHYSNELIIIIINIYNLLFLKVINKRMNGKYKKLYEENYCEIILAGIIIFIIIIKKLTPIPEELMLRKELAISLIISCAAYKIIIRKNKENKENKENKNVIQDININENEDVIKNIIIESIKLNVIYFMMICAIIILILIMIMLLWGAAI